MGIASFMDLDVWKAAHGVTLEVYRLTKGFPSEERFGITTQMRRAAVSISANIAEGFGRRSAQDKARFYNISEGSTEELRYLLRLAGDLDYCKDPEDLLQSLEGVSRMLRRLVQATLRSSFRVS